MDDSFLNIVQAIIEGATAMGIAALALIIVLRFSGQRSDPKLVELLSKITTDAAARDEANQSAYTRLSTALEGNNQEWGTVKDSIQSLISTMQIFIADVPQAHAQQNIAIAGIPDEIIPSIETLQQSVETHQGSVNIMGETVENQNGKIQEILSAIIRIEKNIQTMSGNLNTFQSDLSAEIDNTKKQVVAIKQDVIELQRPATKEVQTTSKITYLNTDKEEDKPND